MSDMMRRHVRVEFYYFFKMALRLQIIFSLFEKIIKELKGHDCQKWVGSGLIIMVKSWLFIRVAVLAGEVFELVHCSFRKKNKNKLF